MSLSSAVRYFADTLAPSQELIQKANNAVERIRQVIIRELGKRYSIARVRPLGSFGKKTSLWFSMDIDVLVYLNEEMPPFEKFRQELDDVVTIHLDENVKQKSLALSFHLDGFQIDLLPARNFFRQHGVNGDKSREEVQVANALQFLRENPHIGMKERNAFSATLSEGCVKFEQLHSGFSHSVSRLAKFWSATIGIPGFSYGRSTVMEYLGARAAEEEEAENRQDIIRAFRRFLQMIVDAKNLNVFWTTFYRIEDIPESVLQQRPLLLDPSSPYNNFLEDDRGDFLSQMSPYAEVTLSRLDITEKKGGFPIDEIFEPQPLWAAIFVNSSKSPRNFLITNEQNAQQHLPEVIRRPGAKGIKTPIADGYIFALVDVLTAAAKFHRKERVSVANSVQALLQQSISPGVWPPPNGKHEDRDMTIIVPVGRKSNEVITISFDWV